jgi:argininosuccinate lyase
LQKFSKLIDKDVFNCLTLKGSIESRKHIGGTGFNAVKATLKQARAKLAK